MEYLKLGTNIEKESKSWKNSFLSVFKTKYLFSGSMDYTEPCMLLESIWSYIIRPSM